MHLRTIVTAQSRLATLLICLSIVAALACTSGAEVDNSAVVVVDLTSADVGTSDLLGNVQDLIVLRDTVWVLNSTEPFFLAFDSRAQFVRAWGTSGGGPLEFSGPTALLGDGRDGTIWAYDAPRHRLRSITSSGERRAEVPVPHESSFHLVSLDHAGTGPGRPWLSLDQSGLLTASAPIEVRGTARLWQAIVGRSVDGVPTDTVFRIHDLLETTGAEPGFMGPHPLWAACPGGSIIVYDPAANSLLRIESGGATPIAASLPDPRRHRITVEGLANLIYQREIELVPSQERLDSAELVQAIEIELMGLGDQVSDVFPEYADLHCTASTVWLQPFDPASRFMGRGPSWLRIDQQGSIQKVAFPENFSPLRFDSERVWGAARDELDVVSIAAVRLEG